jgi:hypothetical protein
MIPSKSFSDRANEAAFWEAWVGSVLTRNGLTVTLHPFTVAATEEEVRSHHHTFDLTVYGKTSVHEVEVKSLSRRFDSDPESWGESKYATLCSQSSYVRKWGMQLLLRRHFLFVSRPTGDILWVPRGVQVTLGATITDASRNETYNIAQVFTRDLRKLSDFVERARL